MAFGSDRSRFVDNQISGKRLAYKLDRFDCVNADFVLKKYMGISSGSVDPFPHDVIGGQK